MRIQERNACNAKLNKVNKDLKVVKTKWDVYQIDSNLGDVKFNNTTPAYSHSILGEYRNTNNVLNY